MIIHQFITMSLKMPYSKQSALYSTVPSPWGGFEGLAPTQNSKPSTLKHETL